MEKEEKIIKDNPNDISTHTNSDNSSVYTHNFKPFQIHLKILKKIKLSEILIRNISKEKDENLFLFKVQYISEENNHVNEWEIYKSFQKIKNLLIISKNYLVKGAFFQNDMNFILTKFDYFINFESKDYSRKLYLLVEFLNDLTKIPKLRDQIFFLEFFEISRNTFDSILEGNKPKEGYILKRLDTKRKTTFARICFCLFCKCRRWKKKWFVLRDDMICYMKDSSSAIGKDIFWFDQELILLKDYNNIRNSLCMINGSRTLILKFEEEFEREIWFNVISLKVKEYQTSLKNNFNSFANEKYFCNARWFVDAESYYSDLYDSLMSAKETIYIAGWWVSPELFLKRPVNLDMYSEHHSRPVKSGVRLMDILKHKAENNVNINILVFKEVTLAVAIDSSHTKDILNNLHPNIKVTRHPKNKTDLLWSHHEKVVIIDEEIGYVGGIDLCWGRFDNQDHKLNELPNNGNHYTWPGIDYSNTRVKDFQNLREYHKEEIDRKTTARMPWHDIHVRLEGPVVSDLCRHFVERWNYARMTITGTFTKEKKHTIVKCKFYFSNFVVKSRSTSYSSFLTRSQKEKDNSDLNAPLLKEVDKLDSYTDSPLDNSFNNYMKSEIQIKVDKKQEFMKVESIIVEQKSEEESDSEDENIKFTKKRNTFFAFTERPKSQNKSSNTNLYYDVNQRRNTTVSAINDNKKNEQIELKNNLTIPFKEKKTHKKRRSIFEKIKGVYSKVKEKIKTKSNDVLTKIGKIYDNKLLNLKLRDKHMPKQNVNSMNCHILRSASNWSIGLNKTESSILEGYYNLIDNAKHYILIENQFFISRSFSEEEYINAGLTGTYPLVNEIRRRIERAYNEGQKFRVFILIPLLPGFEGEVAESATLKLILKYTYKTISRNRGFSLIEKLYQLMQDKYEDYIQFFSLRTHAKINEVPITELIYIHSKMMIVDDEIVVIGSANINDRSMLGSRDTEIAVVIKETCDENRLSSLLDGQPHMVSKFAHSLRVRLFKEYLGIPETDDNLAIKNLLIDPLDDKLFKFMREIARSNSMYYREIFNVYPDDKFMSYADILLAKEINNQEYLDYTICKYEQNKNKIVGLIVEFPLNFLKDENLKISYFCKEILVPIKNFL